MNAVGVLLVMMLPLSISITVNDCPKEHNKDDEYLQVFGDYCYRFVTFQKRHHAGAEAACELHGGTLAIVKSAELSNFLYRHITKTYYYNGLVFIGLNNINRHGQYTWMDGSLLSEGSFQNWAPGVGPGAAHPHGTSPGILMDTSQGGRWVDEACLWGSCKKRRAFICQYKPTTTTTSTSTTTTTPTTSTSTTTTTPTTTTKATTTTTQPAWTPEPTCPPFICDLNCYMDGYIRDAQGCALCSCDVK